MNKKSITILVVCLIVTVLSVSLAYYSARIIGDGKNVSVNAKELTINFDNNNEIASGIIEPGWSSANTFSVTNKSKTNFTYDIVLKNYKNTTKTNGYLVYKITSTNGYNMTEYKDMPKDGDNTYDVVIARGITIEPGSSNKQSYTLEIKYLDSTEDQSIDMGSTVTGSLYIVESTTNENNPYTKGTLGYQIMEDNTNIKERTDFSKAYTDTNIGTMYKAKEDNTDVYYFAGDARNNWVKFGTWKEDKTIIVGYYDTSAFQGKLYDTLEECNTASSYNKNCHSVTLAKKGNAMYWRIIRTNNDGSIRLLYAGTNPYGNEAYVNISVYNSPYNNPMYVGYMYGTLGSLENNRQNTTDSSVKSAIDNWYENNMTSYTKYLSTSAVYCNDRGIPNSDYNTDKTGFNYNSVYRLNTNKTPTYNCESEYDAFSVENANAKLTYPIALMTADEIAYAGGLHNTRSETWVYKSAVLNSDNENIISATGITRWWTMSPGIWEGTISRTYFLNTVAWPGHLSTQYINYGYGVRPVISINRNNIWKSGDGSVEHPYEIVIE